MYQIEFKYNGNNTIIHCNKDEKIKDIVINYVNKVQIDKSKIYFLYEGKVRDLFNEESSLIQMSNSNDKEKKIIILVNDVSEINEGKNIIISKEIICPKCGKNSKIKIKDYRITIYVCKNGHKNNKIKLDKYEDT